MRLLDMHVSRGFYFGYIADFAHVMCKHWEKRKPDDLIQCGGPLCYVLDTLHHSPPDPTHKILAPNVLRRYMVVSMKGCMKLGPERQIYWDYHPEIVLEEPPRKRRAAHPPQPALSQ